MSKSKVTGKRLSIQLGRKETQIALVGKNSELLHCVSLPTPAGAVEDGLIRSQEAVRAMVKEALQAPEFKGVRQVVFSLCTSQVITETAATPDLPKGKLEKLIQANADMYFPVDIQDYRLVWEVIRHKVSPEGAKELDVRLWAVPNEMLRGYYQMANACGLSVAAVDYCGHSIATAVGATFSKPVKPKAKAPKAPKEPREKKKIDWNAEITFGKKKKPEPEVQSEEPAGPRPIPDTDMHILMDHDLLGLTFIQEEQVVYQRFYRCGDDPTYQFSELAMMVEYFQTQEIGRGSQYHGYVTGPCSTDGEMKDLLVSMLGMELEPFQPGQDPRLVLCLGAAQTALDFGNPTFNSPIHARRQINTDLWQYAAILISGAALIAVVITLLNARLGWNSEIANLENQRDLLQIQAAKVSGFKENYENYVSEYNAYDQDWENLFDSLHTYNDNLVFVLKELENVMPANTSVTDIVIDSDSVMISFACDDKEEAAYLIMSLRDAEYVVIPENGISNIIGGGKGAATEYGTPIEEVTPPTEGGSEEQTNAVVVSRDTVRSVAITTTDTSPTIDALKKLEENYGKVPVNKAAHTSLEVFKAKHPVTVPQRQEAIRALLSTNPMIANSFVNMLKEDFYRSGEGKDHIVMILLTSGIPLNQPNTYAEAQALLDQAITVLTKEENLAATEAFLCAGDDPGSLEIITYDLQIAYVHYLEAVMDMWNVPKDSNGNRLFDQYCPYLKVPASQIDQSMAGAKWLYEQTVNDMVPNEKYVTCPSLCNHPDDQHLYLHIEGIAKHESLCDKCGKSEIQPCADIKDGGDGHCDLCKALMGCLHPEELRGPYSQNPETNEHSYVCGKCNESVTEKCSDENKDCSCDVCEGETHNIVFGQIAGTRTHAQSCTNCGEITGDTEPCTDGDGNEKCDVCGGSVAFTRAEIEILEGTHGQVPQPAGDVPGDYESYQEYLADKHPTYFEREAAIRNLFCENAFAANDYFEDIVKIFGYEDKIEATNEFKSIQSILDKVGQLLEINSVDDNDKKLKQIEEMIFGYDPSSGKYDIRTAYLYYLENAMSGKKGDDPHLLAKDEGDMEGVSDPDRVRETWEYVKKQDSAISSRADYENILYNYLMSSSDKKVITNKFGSEMVKDLDKYFDGADAVWQEKYESAFQLAATDSNLRKLMKIGFLLNYYEDPYREYDVLDALVTDYRNGKSAYAAELLLALQLSEREAGIDKDNEQDKTLEDHEKEIEELKKQLEAMKGNGKEEEQGSHSGMKPGDTRVFLDITLLYTDKLWEQELNRKGLDRDAKLPKLELEVDG